MIKSRSFIAIPPGETIKEQLNDRGMTQKEFSARMGISEKHISKLINGEVHLTPEVALRLESVLGLPSSFWNNLESIYRDKIAKATAENELDEDMAIAKKLPYLEMASNGWVPITTNANEKVNNLRRFFEVAKLSLIADSQITRIACRRMSTTEKSDLALLAWSQEARIEARPIETSLTDLKSLEKNLPNIRKMTSLDPSVFCPQLEDLLSNCGIAIVFLPHIKGSFLHGATFIDGKNIVIGLTVRGKDADRFWFSLFHEIGHILLGHLNKKDEITEEDELAADAFARNQLISDGDFCEFVSNKDFSISSIINFSKQIGVDCGIIVGRLQKEGYISFSSLNSLKTKYTFEK